METSLKLLKGGQDEEKFAGLLLVAQLLKTSDPKQSREQAVSSSVSAVDQSPASQPPTIHLKDFPAVYEAIGPTFLKRLLVTGADPPASSSPTFSPASRISPYQVLAVTIISTLCAHPDVSREVLDSGYTALLSSVLGLASWTTDILSIRETTTALYHLSLMHLYSKTASSNHKPSTPSVDEWTDMIEKGLRTSLTLGDHSVAELFDQPKTSSLPSSAVRPQTILTILSGHLVSSLGAEEELSSRSVPEQESVQQDFQHSQMTTCGLLSLLASSWPLTEEAQEEKSVSDEEAVLTSAQRSIISAVVSDLSTVFQKHQGMLKFSVLQICDTLFRRLTALPSESQTWLTTLGLVRFDPPQFPPSPSAARRNSTLLDWCEQLGSRADWAFRFRDGLIDVLSSQVSDEHRTLALSLCGFFLERFGQLWCTLPHPTKIAALMEADGKAGANMKSLQRKMRAFPKILLNHLSIEIPILLLEETGPIVGLIEDTSDPTQPDQDKESLRDIDWESPSQDPEEEILRKQYHRLKEQAETQTQTKAGPPPEDSEDPDLPELESEDEESSEDDVKISVVKEKKRKSPAKPPTTSPSPDSETPNTSPETSRISKEFMSLYLQPSAATQSQERQNTLGLCFRCLELSLQYILEEPHEDGPEWLRWKWSEILEIDDLALLSTRMTDAFQAMLTFLKDVSDAHPILHELSVDDLEALDLEQPHIAAHRNSADMKSALAALEHPLVIGCARAVGLWLAEETEAFREEVVEVLPFLVRVCSLRVRPDSTATAPSSTIQESPGHHISLLLPAFRMLVDEDEARWSLLRIAVQRPVLVSLRKDYQALWEFAQTESTIDLQSTIGGLPDPVGISLAADVLRDILVFEQASIAALVKEEGGFSTLADFEKHSPNFHAFLTDLVGSLPFFLWLSHVLTHLEKRIVKLLLPCRIRPESLDASLQAVLRNQFLVLQEADANLIALISAVLKSCPLGFVETLFASVRERRGVDPQQDRSVAPQLLTDRAWSCIRQFFTRLAYHNTLLFAPTPNCPEKGFFSDYREDGYGGSLVSPVDLAHQGEALRKLPSLDSRQEIRVTWAGVEHLGWSQLPELWNLCLQNVSECIAIPDRQVPLHSLSRPLLQLVVGSMVASLRTGANLKSHPETVLQSLDGFLRACFLADQSCILTAANLIFDRDQGLDKTQIKDLSQIFQSLEPLMNAASQAKSNRPT